MKIKNQTLSMLLVMAVLCVSTGVIGLAAMIHYNKLAEDMENASARAIVGEQVNATILSVVMDSRGIYMATVPEDVEKYGVPLLKSLDKIKGLMVEWRTLMPEGRKAELDDADTKVDEFIRYRAELVRLGREVGFAEARAWGDNDANRANRKKLNEFIVALADANAKEISQILAEMENYFIVQRGILIGALVGLMPMILLLTWIISQRLIVAPLRNMTDVMTVLAGGNLEVAVPGIERKNEIGDMAKALEIFRAGLLDARNLSEAEKQQQQRQAQRVTAMDNLIRQFDTHIKDSLSSINSSSTELEATAQSLTEMAEEASGTATSVAAASEEATTNVQAVAEASEKMSHAINGIIEDIRKSRAAIDNASAEAQETSDLAGGLIEATRKIDDVVLIIQDIAGQTNLLALNATIEAARAGEMGKGFAVVANEVKALANQTANSTELIAEQVGQVQTVTTQVVSAINRIRETIGDINTMSAAVTDTMVAQGSVTAEISANVMEAAEGTKEVNVNITGVSRSAVETGNAASQLLVAVSDIANQSTQLKQQVDNFLRDIKQL